jgi:hypothetical protein
VRVTGETITDEQIRTLRDESLARRRQNAHTRTLRKDCEGALAGSRVCKEMCALAWNRRGSCAIELPSELVAAIEKYLNTDWRDPSKLGALNAVAFIGESVAAIYGAQTGRPPTPERAPSLGSRVRWSSSARGKTTTKTGTVTHVVPAGERPPRKGLSDPGAARDHESYIVRTDEGRTYWPRVDGLEVLP